MNIRDWNPAEGCAFQGDISLVPMPPDIRIERTDEIGPTDGRLIIQEGELTGHRHSIYLTDKVPRFRDDGLARDLAAAAATKIGTARLYRDPAAANEMVQRGILTRADLAVGCLVIEGAPMVISHEKHDGIRIPPGNYLVGRQVESVGAEERRVAD
jgi:hypothetical protein